MIDFFDLSINTIPTMPEIFILILLGGLTYFLKQFASSVNNLKTAVEELRIMFSAEKEKLNSTKELLQNNNSIVETRLGDLEIITGQHSTDIAILKSKIV